MHPSDVIAGSRRPGGLRPGVGAVSGSRHLRPPGSCLRTRRSRHRARRSDARPGTTSPHDGCGHGARPLEAGVNGAAPGIRRAHLTENSPKGSWAARTPGRSTSIHRAEARPTISQPPGIFLTPGITTIPGEMLPGTIERHTRKQAHLLQVDRRPSIDQRVSGCRRVPELIGWFRLSGRSHHRPWSKDEGSRETNGISAFQSRILTSSMSLGKEESYQNFSSVRQRVCPGRKKVPLEHLAAALAGGGIGAGLGGVLERGCGPNLMVRNISRVPTPSKIMWEAAPEANIHVCSLAKQDRTQRQEEDGDRGRPRPPRARRRRPATRRCSPARAGLATRPDGDGRTPFQHSIVTRRGKWGFIGGPLGEMLWPSFRGRSPPRRGPLRRSWIRPSRGGGAAAGVGSARRFGFHPVEVGDDRLFSLRRRTWGLPSRGGRPGRSSCRLGARGRPRRGPGSPPSPGDLSCPMAFSSGRASFFPSRRTVRTIMTPNTSGASSGIGYAFPGGSARAGYLTEECRSRRSLAPEGRSQDERDEDQHQGRSGRPREPSSRRRTVYVSEGPPAGAG